MRGDGRGRQATYPHRIHTHSHTSTNIYPSTHKRRHLGHVFRNEGFPNPPPNERHCVNGVSVAFVPEGKDPSEAILPSYDGPVYEG